MNGSTTGSLGSGAGPAWAGGVPGVPMDSKPPQRGVGIFGSAGGD